MRGDNLIPTPAGRTISVRSRAARRLAAAVTLALLPLAAAGTAFASASTGSAPVAAAASLTQVSTDPFTDTDAQHATEVEPDIYAHGSTIVSAFQTGRVYGGGSSDLGWATSTNGGSTWTHGFLPGLTVNEGGSYASVSDAAVVYDAKHAVWLVVGLPIDSKGSAVGVTVNRSTDGLTWQNATQAVGFDGQGYDKQWITCDDTSTSPYYGNCYIEVDVTSSNNLESMAVSTDGGVTWSALGHPADNPSGLGGQPLVQPNGTVVVPYSANGSAIRSFTSTNGGASWTASVQVASITSHKVAGGLRSGDGLPSASIDGAGRVYVAWQDCRFRASCSSNDIVYSTSTDGTSWSAVARVPIDAVGSTVDHFIPGFGVDGATSGSTAKIGLYYYFYPNAKCSSSTCKLEVGYTSSTNGGASWSTAQTLAGPFGLSLVAKTSQGRMVGDYIASSVVNGTAYAVFAVGATPANGEAFNEAMYAPTGGLPVTG
jgi:hypothetical protein